MIMKKVKVVKFLMNVLPNKPEYQENHFCQEMFRHPKYISLTQNEKELFFERIVKLRIIEAKRKPFDLFFPSYYFRKIIEGKRVLDIGCGIGGDTISMGENWNVKEFYGIDVSQNCIMVASHFISKHLKNVKFQFKHCYAEKTSFENDFFDAIVSYDTIE